MSVTDKDRGRTREHVHSHNGVTSCDFEHSHMHPGVKAPIYAVYMEKITIKINTTMK